MVDQPAPEVNVTKQALQEKLSGTQYDHPGIVNGLHLVLGNGLDQLHTSAICISLVCLSFTRDNTIQPANEETRDPKELLPRGSKIFPPEIAILLKAIDKDDKNTTKDYAFHCVNPNVTRLSDHQLLRFVRRGEFNNHIKKFKFVKKWKNLCLEIKDVAGITNKKIGGDTMLRYLKNFLSVVTWLNKTNKLCPSRDFTANINDLKVVCGSYYENYFYQQIRQDTNEQETDAQFIYRKKTDFNREFGVAIKTAHLYLGDKKLRQLNGDEKKITAALNLGCAENYYLTNKEVVPKEQCVLVVGVIDFLSDYCMKRIATMDDVVSPPPGGLYTIGSRPIKKPLSVHTLTHSGQLRNNLFLGWDSPVLFPTLAHKFPTNIVFQEIYVDDLVDVDMVSFRGATMRDFYEQLLPQLRSAMLIGDETTAHIPFATEAMVALHASWRAVEKYATITFVKKNVGCEWKTRTSDDTNEDLKASKNTNATDANMSTAYNQVGVCRATLLSDINKCKLRLEASKKKRKRNPNVNGNVECVDTKAITSLVLAGTQWSKCTDEAVDDIGWIKMQFKKEVNMTEHIVKYPINNTENVTNDPPLDNGIASSLDLSCNLQNLEEFSQFLEANPNPRINLEFKDKTSKSVESIVVSKSLTIAGVVPPETGGLVLLNRVSQYTPELITQFTQEGLEEITKIHLDNLSTNPNPYNRNEDHYSDGQREWAKIEVLNTMSQTQLDNVQLHQELDDDLGSE